MYIYIYFVGVTDENASNSFVIILSVSVIVALVIFTLGKVRILYIIIIFISFIAL